MEPLFETLRKVLENYPSVRLCTVFGSTASGRATSESDLDVAVAAEEPFTAEKRLREPSYKMPMPFAGEIHPLD